MMLERIKRNYLLDLAVVVLLMGMMASIYIATGYAIGDILTLQARSQINAWQRQTASFPRVGEIGKALNSLNSGARWLPGDPVLIEGIGYLYGLRANIARNLPELEHAMLDEVLVAYRSAVARRPMSAYAWANIALVLHRKNADLPEIWIAVDRALLYGQREAGVQIRLAEVVFRRWEEAGDSRRAAFREILSTSRGRVAGDLRKIVEVAGQPEELAYLPG